MKTSWRVLPIGCLLLGSGQSKGCCLPLRKVQGLGFAEVTPYGVPFERTLQGVLFDGPNLLPPGRVISYPVHLCRGQSIRVVYWVRHPFEPGLGSGLGSSCRLDRDLQVSPFCVGGMVLVAIIVRQLWGIHSQGNRRTWSIIPLFGNASSQEGSQVCGQCRSIA